MIKSSCTKFRRAAYSFLEILLVVGSLSVVVGGGIYAVQRARESSAEAKLRQDVQRINNAISVYTANGGRLPDSPDAQIILKAMRRVAAKVRDAQGNEKKLQAMAGLSGQMIDPRVNIRWQTVEEAQDGDIRAYWNNADKRFVLAESGNDAGVKEFYLGDMPEPEVSTTDANGNVINPNEDDRAAFHELNTEAGWIWSAEAQAAGNAPAPRATGTGTGATGATSGGTDDGPRQLLVPQFSRQGGAYDLIDYPLSITLSDPNPATMGEVFYKLDEGSWVKYQAPVTVEIGNSLSAKTVSLHLDRFYDSDESTIHTYTVNSVKPEFAVTMPKGSFDYFELGGAAVGGSAPVALPQAVITLENVADIPTALIADTSFMPWRVFGSHDPLDSASPRTSSPGFAGGMPPISVPLSLANYETSGLTLRAAAQAVDLSRFINSDIAEASAGITKLDLPEPLIATSGAVIAIAPGTGPTLPLGYRIFYTLDGSDPGDNGSGGPGSASALLYTAPVTAPAGLSQVTARVYGPAGAEHWFRPSPLNYASAGSTASGIYFASSASQSLIYQIDPATGTNVIATRNVLFPPAALAMDDASSRVYYVESGSTGWRVAHFPAGGTAHTIAGSLTAPGLFFTPTVQPTNLTAFNGSLYYAAENSDDLIRVELNADGTIRQQYHCADLTGDALAFSGIGDIAVSPSGKLILSSTAGWAVFDMVRMVPENFSNAPAARWDSLLFATNGTLYGTDAAATALSTVAPADGAVLGSVVTSPERSFDDFASPLATIPQNLGGMHYAIRGDRNAIYRLNVATGANYIMFAGLPRQPTCIAHDYNGGLLYFLGRDTATNSQVLTRYSIATGEVADLGLTGNVALAYSTNSTAHAACWVSGGFYWIPEGSDSLLRTVPGASGISTQTREASINGGTAVPDITAMTTGPDGLIYFASTDAFYATVDPANPGLAEVLRSGAGTGYQALTSSNNGELFGVLADADPVVRQQLQRVDEVTGSATAASPTVPPADFTDISGLDGVATPPLAVDYFAVDGSTRRLYRIAPATGRNTAIVTSSLPWVPGAVAFDKENRRVYYTSRSTAALGVYDIAAGIHSLPGTLDAAVLQYRASGDVGNLAFFNGGLYYVDRDDDLVRVEFKADGTIADAWKVADLTGNSDDLEEVGDIAFSPAGMLYVSSEEGFARFNMTKLNGWTVLDSSPSDYYGALLFTEDNGFYGTNASQPRYVQAVNTSNGSATLVAPTSPFRPFVDAASGVDRVPVDPPSGSHYAVSGSGNSIYRINLATGSVETVTASCPVVPESIAHNPTEKALYYSNAAGELKRYSLETMTHAAAGSLVAPSLGYIPASAPKHLFFFNGAMHYVAPGTDDLVSVNFTSGQIATAEKLRDIAGGTADLGVIGAAAVGLDGDLYLSRQDGNWMGRYNLYTSGPLEVVNTTTARFASLAFDSALNLHGTLMADTDTLVDVSTADGATSGTVAISGGIGISDIAGNNTTPPPPVTGDSYAVTGGTSIYRFNPQFGYTRAITTSAPFNLRTLARDPDSGTLYYTENAASGWRLGRYVPATGIHTSLGSLPAVGGLSYAVPENLFFYHGTIYYIATNTDDLVAVRLSGDTIAAHVKVRDITNNVTEFGAVGDVAVDQNGLAWIAEGSGRISTFSMKTLGSWTAVATSGPVYNSLLFTETGALFGAHSGAPESIQAVNRETAASEAAVATSPAIAFMDMAGHEPGPGYDRSDSMWGIFRNGTGGLMEFKDWNLPGAEARNYGQIRYMSGGVATAFTGSPGIDAMCITNEGSAYFVRNLPTTVNGTSRRRPVFRIDLGTLTWGSTPTPPVAHFVGDLAQVLGDFGAYSDAGSLDRISGMTIGTDGRMYLAWDRGNSSTADFLLRLNSLSTDAAGMFNNWSLCGTMTGAGTDTVTQAQDLAFTTTGALLVTDDFENTVHQVNPLTGAVAAAWSTDSSGYEGMAVHKGSGDVVISNISTLGEVIRRVTPGPNNDVTLYSYLTLSGGIASDIQAIGFYSNPLGAATPPPAYYAADGTSRLYTIDPLTGTAGVLTSSAPMAVDSVAFDQVSGKLYCIGTTDAPVALSVFDLAARTHTALGDLTAVGPYTLTAHPQHLVRYGGGLYFVHPGTDDLVRVDFDGNTVVALTKVADINGNAALPAVTAATVDDNGKLHLAWDGGLAVWNLRTPGTLATLSTTFARADGMLWRAADDRLYVNQNAAPSAIVSLPAAGGALSAPVAVNPTEAFTDMASGNTAAQPEFTTQFYAVSGTGTSIYKFDRIAGWTIVFSSNAPFPMESVAVNPAETSIYYVEKAASGWRLGEYSIDSGTHIDRGALTSAGYSYVAASQPTNLTYVNGMICYVAAGTDDLVGIEINATTGAVIDQAKIADLNNDVALTGVADLALDADGRLFISAPEVFASYDFTNFSNYRVLNAAPAYSWGGLATDAGGNLFGVRADQPGRLYSVNKETGAGTFLATWYPSAQFIDMASPQAPVPMHPQGIHYFVSTGSNTIFRLDTATGRDYFVTDQVPLDQPHGIALNGADSIIYTLGTRAASPGDVFLARFNTRSGEHLDLGSLRSASLAYQPASTPRNLVFFNGFLYYMAWGTDDLVQITLNPAGTAIAAQQKVGDLGGVSRQWNALTVGPDSLLYLSASDSHFLATYDLAALAGFDVIKSAQGSDDGAAYTALTFDAAGQLHGAMAAAPTRIYRTSQTTGATAHWKDTIPARSIMDLTATTDDGEVLNMPYYAVDGGRKIYRVDPLTGKRRVVNSSAPYDLEAVAVNDTNTIIYYVEKAASNWKLGAYTLATQTHTNLTTLNSTSWFYRATAQPSNLTFINGRLYYIHEGTDDLVAVDLGSNGLTVSSVEGEADMSGGTVAFTGIGDLVVDTSGVLYLSATQGIYSWNFRSKAGLNQLSAVTSRLDGMFISNTGAFFGSRTLTPAIFYSLDKATGVSAPAGALLPPAAFTDMASTQLPVTIDPAGLYFSVTKDCPTIHRLDLQTGMDYTITWGVPGQPMAIAMERETSSIFTIGYKSTSATIPRLWKYDLQTDTHTELGTLQDAGLSYSASTYPRCLTWVNDGLYYMAYGTDDLVRIELNAARTAISAQVKVADIGSGDQNWDGLNLGMDGMLYMSSGTSHLLAKYNLATLSGYATIRTTADANIGALTFGTDGQMYGVLATSDSEMQKLRKFNSADGSNTFWKNLIPAGIPGPIPTLDITCPFDSAEAPARPLWAITATGTNYHLVEFRNYNRATRAAVDFGDLTYLDGATQRVFPVGTSYCGNLTVSDAGIAWFTVTGPVTFGGVTKNYSLWSVNLNGLTVGTAPALSFVGWLDSAMATLKGSATVPANDQITGLAIRPAANEICGVFNVGGAATADIFFRITSAGVGADNELAGVSAIRTWNSGLVINNAGGLAFGPDGTGYVTDLATSRTVCVSGTDGALIGVHSVQTSTPNAYTDIAVNPEGGEMIGSAPDAGGKLMNRVTFGAENDTLLFNYGDAPFNQGATDAIAFLTFPVVLPTGTTAPYYAVSGGNTIFEVNPATGYRSALTTSSVFSKIECVAVNEDRSRIYYIEQKTSSPWRIAYYNMSAGTHHLVGSMNNGYWVNPSSQPRALSWINGNLIYVADNSDELVTVTFTDNTKTTIRDISPDTPMNGWNSLGTIGDLAVDSDGWLWVSGSNGLLKWNYRSRSGGTMVSGALGYHWRGLATSPDGKLYGARSDQPTKIYEVSKITGTGSNPVDINPSASFIDMASAQPVQPLDIVNTHYFVTPSCWTVHSLNIQTGLQTTLYSGTQLQPAAITMDRTNRILYMIGDDSNGTSQAKMVSYDLNTGTNRVIGDLRSGTLAYQCPASTPQCCVFYSGNLYYLAPGTDDLVKVTLDSTSVTAAVKVADLGTTQTWGSMTIGPDGRLYIASKSTNWYARYNIATLNGLTVLRTSTGSDAGCAYEAMTFDAAGQMYGVPNSQNQKLYKVTRNTGVNAFWKNTEYLVSMLDITGMYDGPPPGTGASFWAVVETGTEYRLVKVVNYDQVTRHLVDYGQLRVTDGTNTASLTTSGPVIHAFTATDAGLGYFANYGTITLGSKTIRRGLFSINLASLTQGAIPTGTLIGDMEPRLRTMLGDSAPISDWLTGLAIHPVTGVLYGLTQDGDTSTGVDRIFKINSATKDASGTLTDLSWVGTNGNVTGAAGSAVHTKDLAFLPDGSLYVSDWNGLKIFKVNPDTAAVQSIYSTETADGYVGLTAEPAANQLIGATFNLQNVRKITAGGSGDDTQVFHYSQEFGITRIQAMSFLTYPHLFAPTLDTPYFGVNGTRTIYRMEPADGTVVTMQQQALFNADSIAWDDAAQTLYYVEATDTNYRLGRYNIDTATQHDLGNLENAAWNLTSGDLRPRHLFVYNGEVYFIRKNSDQLVRVRITGNAITAVDPVTRLFAPGASLDVQSAAVDSAGKLWFTTADRLYRFDLVTLSGLADLGAYPQCNGLMFSTAGTLLAMPASSAARFHTIVTTPTVAAPVAGVATSPSVAMTDIAGPNTAPAPEALAGLILVTGFDSHNVVKYDSTSGTWSNFIAARSGGLVGPYDFAIGADRKLYVTSTSGAAAPGMVPNAVLRYDLSTGAFIDVFVASGSGGLVEPKGLTFGPDGNLYVTCAGTAGNYRVKKYSGANGAAMGDFVTGIGEVSQGIAFGPDGSFYVADKSDNAVERYNGVTGAFIETVVNSASGIAFAPRDLEFGTDGSLYLDTESSRLYRINVSAKTATQLSDYSAISGYSTGLGLDSDGNYHIADYNNDRVLRFGADGSFRRVVAQGGLLSRPKDIISSPAAGWPAAPTEDLFAVNGGTGIYRVDPATGQSVLLTQAPWSLESVAFDVGSGALFYTEASDATIRLGRYQLASGTHVELGDLKTAGTDRPSIRPRHLVAADGVLFYIMDSTDDLIRVETDATSILTQAKQADLNANTSLGTVTAATLSSSGTFYFTTTGAGSVIRSFDLPSLGALSTVPGTHAGIHGLMNSGSSYYGVTAAAANSFALVNMTTGAVSAGQPVFPAAWFSDLASGSTAAAPPPPLVPWFAVDRTTTIHRVNPATGSTAPLTTAPFALDAVAYDQENRTIYYIEYAATGFRLGRGVITGGTVTHTTIGSLQSTSYAYSPLTRPQHLVFCAGDLYYIAPASDDLVRIRLSGSTISSQQKVADIANDTAGFTVTAAALDDSGNLRFSSGTSLFRYSLTNAPRAGVTQLWTGGARLDGLLWTGSDIIASRETSRTRLDTLVLASSPVTIGAGLLTSPAVSIRDMAGGNSSPAPVEPLYFGTTGTNQLRLVNPLTGAVSVAPGGTAAFAFDTIAYDEDRGYVYYIEASAANERLGRYDVASATYTTLGQIADTTTWSYNPSQRPLGLAFYNGALYYVARSSTAANSDDLVRIRFNTDGTIAAQELVTNVNANATFPAVQAMTVDDSGVLWMSTATVVYSWNLRTQSTRATVRSSAPQYNALMWRRGDNYRYGVNNADNQKLATLDTTAAVVGSPRPTSPSTVFTDLASGNQALPPEGESQPSVYIAGTFSRASDGQFKNLARLTPAGNLDTSFNVGAGANGQVNAVLRMSDGRVFAAGEFSTFNGVARTGVAVLLPDGSLDTTWNPSVTSASTVRIYAAEELADGRILIGGTFDAIGGSTRKNLAAINADGTLDTAFNPNAGSAAGPNNTVYSLKARPDGKIYVGGVFSSWNGQTSGGKIALLTSTGARDTSWTSSISTGATDSVNWIDIDSTGKPLVAGAFTAPRNRIARLLTTGGNDSSFSPGTGANNTITSAAIQTDGMILVAGNFTSMAGTTRNRVAKLNSAGAHQTAWNPGTGYEAQVEIVRLITGATATHMGGSFATFNGASRNKITALSNAAAAGTMTAGSELTISVIKDVR